MSKPFHSYKVKSKHWNTQGLTYTKNSLQIYMIEEENVNKRTSNCLFKGAHIYSLKDSRPQVFKKNAWSTIKGEDQRLPQCL